MPDFAGVLRFVRGDSVLRRPKALGLPPAREGAVAATVAATVSNGAVLIAAPQYDCPH